MIPSDPSPNALTGPKPDEAVLSLIRRLTRIDPRLATIIQNTYTLEATASLLQGLDTMCAPTDTYGFSSCGIYVFWNTESKEVLYVGLAVDLPLRFRHHNNLIPCAANCCKWAHIQRHFEAFPKLGYSILVQSSLHQAVCGRWESENSDYFEWLMERFGFLSFEEAKLSFNRHIDRTLRRTEGEMLAVHVRDHGRLPAWNKIGGMDANFSDEAIADAREYLKAATGIPSGHDLLVARSSLVEMEAKPLWTGYEEQLHAVRILVRGLGIDWNDAVALYQDPLSYLKAMAKDGYLTRNPAL